MNARDHRLLATALFLAAVSVVALCFLSGCTSTLLPPKISISQASSELDYQRQYARAVQSGYTMIHGTGRSMVPYFGPGLSDDVLLCSVYAGQPLRERAVVCYQQRPGDALTAHMVSEVSTDGKKLRLIGTGNLFYDGWFDISSVRYVVHGTIRRPNFNLN